MRSQDFIQNPAASHIPRDQNLPRSAGNFPWRMGMANICLYMMKGEERKTETGIILPDIEKGIGKEKRRTTGICVAIGPGEPLMNGGYLSPEHDLGVIPGSICFISPNTGQVIYDDEHEYRIVQPIDVLMVLNAEFGAEDYARLRKSAVEAVSSYGNGSKDASTASNFRLPSAPVMRSKKPWEKEPGEVQELQKELSGTRSKPGISVPGIPKEE